MSKTKRSFYLFPRYFDRLLFVSALVLTVFGTIMIVSAEMGNAAGDPNYLTKAIIKQLIIVAVSLILFFFVLRVIHSYLLQKRKFSLFTINVLYGGVIFLLLLCRLFAPANGAYAWIRLGSLSLQPSELAKVFTVFLAAELLSEDRGEENLSYVKRFAWMVGIFIIIIIMLQKDFGSAVVLAGIAYCCILILPYRQLRKLHKNLKFVLFFGIIAVLVILSPIGTWLLKKMPYSYKIARVLVSADPFEYQYDDGYHLIMSMVTLASGGFFGVGLGNSIHKYMNFPNPSTDFILPVIVEELGIIGLLFLVLFYGLLLYPLVKWSTILESNRSKIVCLGVFIYFTLHIIFNVGGISGLIPLTGVPLLFISSGGTSLMASYIGLALVEAEVCAYRRLND